MEKINGYTEDEAKELVEYIKAGKQKGKTLSYLFASYGLQRGRAKGSVRNYYYALMKNEKQDERIVKLLDGSQLKVEKIREFSEEETDQAIRSILAEKSKGLSVRRAIFNLSAGDDKLTLRLQNKYRNVLKKEPARIARLAEELGLKEEAEIFTRRAVGQKAREEKPSIPDKDFLRRRLENEINALYERLAFSLKEENERLKKENAEWKKQLESMQK
jgi:hypothetical protein